MGGINTIANKIKYILFFACCMVHCCIYAQPFQRFDYLPVAENSKTLSYPWTGGVNSVQFGKADVNHDGKKDLVVYDKNNRKYCIFLTQASNSVNFKFQSEYAAYFPPISGWMILKDYNCDGIEDLFTYNGIANLKVFTGYYVNDTMNFKLQQDGFYYNGGGGPINTYVSDVIKPAIVDVNKDGDLDIISFNVFGNRIIYYENQQKELTLSCDSLFFTKSDNCWGNVRDTFSAAYALRDTCSFKFNRPNNSNNVMHTGSTIEGYDVDNNGAVDVLIGSVTLSTITMLYNNGVPSYASILKQDVTYPSYDIPYNTPSFSATAFLDADNDGKTDLLVSTFDAGVANVNNIWWYKNNRPDSLNLLLQQKDFLLDNMIDAGENSNPCFMDVDGDGLKDILLGSGGYKDNINPDIFKLRFYKNTGGSDYPQFTLQDDDFLTISGLGVRDIVPSAGDIDNDHDTDLVVGISDGRLLFWENTALPGNAPVLTYRGILKDSSGSDISIGANACPDLVDLNRDGKTDLVIGERNGNINYYRGTSGNSAKFSFVTDSLGKIRIKNASSNFGYTQPCITDVNNNGKYDLVLGTNFSGLQFYNDIEDHLNDTFMFTSNMVSMDLGLRTTAAVDDITNDGKLELLTGNVDGGLIIFSQEPPPFRPTPIKYNIAESLKFNIFPNPADNMISINLNELKNSVQLQLFNSLGQEIISQKYTRQDFIQLNTSTLSNGMYLLKISDREIEGMKKIVILH